MRSIIYSLIIFLICNVKIMSDMLPVSLAEGGLIHLTQIYSPDYNPNGPASSNNCGPASFAMCLRALGYFGYGPTLRVDPEHQVDHSRYLFYNYSTGSISYDGITYSLYDNDTGDSALTDFPEMETGIARLGGISYSVTNQTDLDTYLDNGIPIILKGSLDNTGENIWQSLFENYLPGQTGIHFVAVTGKTPDGYYIVNDPLYLDGCVLMDIGQLLKFDNGYLDGRAFYWRMPRPSVVTKNNNRLMYVFMRKKIDGFIYYTRQESTGSYIKWTGWTCLGTYKTMGNPVAIEQPDGNLLVFTRSAENNHVYIFKEQENNGTFNLIDLNGATYYDPAACKNQNDTVEVYVRGTTGHIWKKTQLSINGDFSPDWNYIDANNTAKSGPEAIQNINGCIQIFAGNTIITPSSEPKTVVTNIQQTAVNDWTNSTFTNLDYDAHIINKPVAILHSYDNLKKVFVRGGSDSSLFYKDETATGWSDIWERVGSTPLQIFGIPAVLSAKYYIPNNRYQKNNIRVFVRGLDNGVYYTTREWSNTSRAWVWSEWLIPGVIKGTASSDIAVGKYLYEERTFFCVLGSEGRMYYQWQSLNYDRFSGWNYLGSDGTNTYF